MINLQIVTKENIFPYIPILAQWRIDAFKEFPYLYDGNLEYEEKYLQHYVNGKDSIFVLAFENEILVGICTGIAFSSEFDIINPIESLNNLMDLEKTIYLGEIIIHPDYQGKGIASKIFKKFEEYYKSLSYKYICFLTVLRDENHPLKPQNYQKPDIYWNALGYQKTSIITTYQWPTFLSDGSAKNADNEMIYWWKDI